MEIFDTHVHYSLDTTLEDAVRLFRREFDMLGIKNTAFLSLPHHAEVENGEMKMSFDKLQNLKGLYLKKVFSPNAYAFAGLEHPTAEISEKERENLYLNQAKEYFLAGYDGIKMLEGYPSMRKAMGIKLCDKVYDGFYSFLEEKGIPVTLHIANPEENWDITKVDEYALKAGRFCDSTFPTKAQLHQEVDEILKKHPKLRLTLAHFGFLSYDLSKAKAFLDDYPNTLFDITPGGEQYFIMQRDWENWHKFFIDYADRIVYGDDLYAFPYESEEEWQVAVKRRPIFIRQFFETDGEHEYLGERFYGAKLESEVIEKIYYKNAERLLGAPKPIDEKYLKAKSESLLKTSLTPRQKNDLEFILGSI